MSIEDLVASFLSPSERVKAVLETLIPPEPGSAMVDGADVIDPRFSVQDTRILAVVSHVDEWNLTEEGWYV
jgi:phosphatidylinositol-bisphosphatase